MAALRMIIAGRSPRRSMAGARVEHRQRGAGDAEGNQAQRQRRGLLLS
jgi:hypothetical protein